MRHMKLRILTTLAVAAIAFWAGLRVDSARTTGIDIPSSLPPITTTDSGSVRTTSWAMSVAIDRPPSLLDNVSTAAALVAAAFLLARFGIAVTRRRQARAA